MTKYYMKWNEDNDPGMYKNTKMHELFAEINEEGFAEKEIGLNLAGETIHRFPKPGSQLSVYGVNDLVQFEVPVENDLTAEEFYRMWGPEEPDPAPITGYSFTYWVPLVLYPIIIFLAMRSGEHWLGWIFHGLFALLVAAFGRMALSMAQYEKIHAQDPTLNRLTWVLNYLLFFVIVPALVWALIFIPRFFGS